MNELERLQKENEALTLALQANGKSIITNNFFSPVLPMNYDRH